MEASITASDGQPSSALTASATRRAACAPASPVKALAQPALTTSARASPRVWASAALHQSTGAEPTLFWVKTPAQAVPSAKRNSTRSGRACL